MQKERQLEEMAKDLEQAKIDAMYTLGSLSNGFGMWYAAWLHKAGYRKQSDTVQEFMQKFHNAIAIPTRTDGKRLINQMFYVLRNIAQEYLKEEKNE